MHEQSFDFDAGGQKYLAPSGGNFDPQNLQRIIGNILGGVQKPLAQALTPEGMNVLAAERSQGVQPPAQQNLKKEVLAHQQLASQGSVMGQDRSRRPFQGTPNLDPLLQTIGQILNTGNPMNWMGGMAGASSAAGLAGRTGKTFTEAAPSTIEGLIQALGKGSASMPGRASLRPALRHTGTGEIASGGIGAGHGSIYDVVPPSWQKQVQHGFLHPEGQFLTQSLIDALVQPKVLKTLSGGLSKGKSLDELLQSMMMPKYSVGSAQKLPPSLP